MSISLVVLLTLTTPWVRLLAALRSLGVPRIFVLIIGMAYRYIFLLLGSVTDMYEARKARTVGPPKHDSAARAFVAATAGALLGKSHATCPKRCTRRWSPAASAVTPRPCGCLAHRRRDVLCTQSSVAAASAVAAVLGDRLLGPR